MRCVFSDGQNIRSVPLKPATRVRVPPDGASVDAYIFHQANKFMLDRLREECGNLDPAKFFNNIMTRGNTVSSSIPIAIIDASRDGLVHPGSRALLVGFGVGLSWGACFARFPENFRVAPLED